MTLVDNLAKDMPSSRLALENTAHIGSKPVSGLSPKTVLHSGCLLELPRKLLKKY